MKVKIVFKDGSDRVYRDKEFTDYAYDRKSFIMIKKKQWVGIYNLDTIKSIEVKKG